MTASEARKRTADLHSGKAGEDYRTAISAIKSAIESSDDSVYETEIYARLHSGAIAKLKEDGYAVKEDSGGQFGCFTTTISWADTRSDFYDGH